MKNKISQERKKYLIPIKVLLEKKKIFKKSKKKKIASSSHSINNFNRIFSNLGSISKCKNNR